MWAVRRASRERSVEHRSALSGWREHQVRPSHRSSATTASASRDNASLVAVATAWGVAALIVDPHSDAAAVALPAGVACERPPRVERQHVARRIEGQELDAEVRVSPSAVARDQDSARAESLRKRVTQHA